MKDLSLLRQQYPTFSYDSYTWELKDHTFHASWVFVAGEHRFNPHLEINLPSAPLGQDAKALDNLVFHLGLAEIFSYWKATISPRILIKSGALTPTQITWWEKLHLHGMGQFFYENNIKDFASSFRWECDSSLVHDPFTSTSPGEANLVLLGGGKDSLVSAQLLKEHHLPVIGYALNPAPAVTRLAKSLPLPDLIVAKHTIDPHLLELNSQGYPNGHVPFSAYLAFSSLLVAYLCGTKYVLASNEASAEAENVISEGFKVNHQYSKTLAFEQDFQRYTSEYLTSDVTYFSFLRPFYELQISGIFTRYPQYFGEFRSCNVGQKSDRWCGNCPKCLSIYLLLGAFIGPAEMVRIFGTDVLDNQALLPIFQAMIEEGQTRPFECIGTRVETIVAASMIISRYSSALPALLKYFQRDFLPKSNLVIETAREGILQSFAPHSMPASFATILQQSLPIKLQ